MRRGGRVHALLDDVCSHQDHPLSQGEVTDDAIECCAHGARFDLSTGAALTPPASEPVPVYPVRVREGEVYVMVTETDSQDYRHRNCGFNYTHWVNSVHE